MDLVKFLNDYWLVLAGIFSGIWGYAHLHAEVKALKAARSNEIEEHKEKEKTMWAKVDSMNTTLTAVLTEVAHLRGMLEGRK